ncbi:ShlB/FhaC/HecB family hemolysin secretion/activation protein [Duganella aceris]|uniref:ShlB/FhaC/HecB family hemolysin secretion/activation protein n=1 Tax=Duganella aceris TaxID=2703883 RepID=A0ABX0FSZ7_9BURK|nr:ShlB/FhaC/HecB family hemolysin secretion/activation protein [Duganella aceris]NGZ87804.1 ShlB/FhaC/HecB family hemolysin secretion/activation protein [Duganella aceris]
MRRRLALAAVLAHAGATAPSAQAQTRPDAGQVVRELGRPDAAPRLPPPAAPPITLPPDVAPPPSSSPPSPQPTPSLSPPPSQPPQPPQPTPQPQPTPLPSPQPPQPTPSPSPPSPPPGAPTPPSSRPADDTTIAVAGFRISGATAFAPAQLERLLVPWRGRRLTLADLQAAANRIGSHYRDHGYLLARAYLPAQTISDGQVEIAVLEGRIGTVILASPDQALANQARSITERIAPGLPARESDLERMLLALNDSPGIERADAALQPGASVGLTDLVVTLSPGPAVSGELGANNHGNRYTGRHLAGGAVTLNSPAHLGDQFSARFQGSDQRLYYTRLSYRLPLGGSGLVAGAAWTLSRYHLGRDFAALDAHGDARIASLFAYHPLLLTRDLSLTASIAADRKTLHDNVDALSTASDKTITLATAGLSGNLRWRGGSYAFSLAYTGGVLAIQHPEALAADAATARSNGHYAKWSYAMSVSVPVATAWLASAQLNGQYARKNLDSSEKFTLGGADGVRGYPQGEAPADTGILLTLALRRALPMPRAGTGEALLGAFVDAGQVRTNHTPFSADDNRRRLAAIGLSFECPLPAHVQFRSSLAWKLGHRAATSDRDRGLRAWLSATAYF